MAQKAYGNVLLFYTDTNRRLIISAHGGYLTGKKKYTLPRGTLIYRTSAFGLSTTSQVQNIVDWQNHGGKTGTESGNQWQCTLMGGEQTNFYLSQYAEAKGKGPDTYHHYLSVAKNEGFDIASPLKEIQVSTVFDSIPNILTKYRAIWFSFCLSKI